MQTTAPQRDERGRLLPGCIAIGRPFENGNTIGVATRRKKGNTFGFEAGLALGKSD